jgi:hypothetical protein
MGKLLALGQAEKVFLRAHWKGGLEATTKANILVTQCNLYTSSQKASNQPSRGVRSPGVKEHSEA